MNEKHRWIGDAFLYPAFDWRGLLIVTLVAHPLAWAVVLLAFIIGLITAVAFCGLVVTVLFVRNMEVSE